MNVLTTTRGAAALAHLPELTPTGQQAATLRTWFIRAHPEQHAAWNCYLLSCVHLRDMEGVPPPVKQFPDAQYEIIVVALHPKKQPRADDLDTWQHLAPPNVNVQFGGINDAQAQDLTDDLVQLVIDGALMLEPEGITGARCAWFDAIDRLCTRTAEGMQYRTVFVVEER